MPGAVGCIARLLAEAPAGAQILPARFSSPLPAAVPASPCLLLPRSLQWWAWSVRWASGPRRECWRAWRPCMSCLQRGMQCGALCPPSASPHTCRPLATILLHPQRDLPHLDVEVRRDDPACWKQWLSLVHACSLCESWAVDGSWLPPTFGQTALPLAGASTSTTAKLPSSTKPSTSSRSCW